MWRRYDGRRSVSGVESWDDPTGNAFIGRVAAQLRRLIGAIA
jgi:hypothetical protein